MMMKRCFVWLLVALMAVPMGFASGVRDDDDKDPSMKPGIRRLHPERERAKAAKKLREQMSRKTEPKADPWDTSDEVWGTVDVAPVTIKDSMAVVGHRVDEQHRLMWRDEPVTATRDQLMSFMTIDGDEVRSKYVTIDHTSNEVYFAFDLPDSVPGPLRLCVRYCADAPFGYDQLTFSVDGYDYVFYPVNIERGRLDSGVYWECSDDELQEVHKDLVYALAHGQWIMLMMSGENGVKRVKVLTDGQRDDFANTLALFRLLGGGW